jgi:hypothetical protein
MLCARQPVRLAAQLGHQTEIVANAPAARNLLADLSYLVVRGQSLRWRNTRVMKVRMPAV